MVEGAVCVVGEDAGRPGEGIGRYAVGWDVCE